MRRGGRGTVKSRVNHARRLVMDAMGADALREMIAKGCSGVPDPGIGPATVPANGGGTNRAESVALNDLSVVLPGTAQSGLTAIPDGAERTGGFDLPLRDH